MMEISTISNDTMSITCVEDNLVKTNEELIQQLFEIKQQLLRCERMKSDLEGENEKLEAENSKLQTIFEGEKNEIVINYTERVSRLQAILDEEREHNLSQYNALLKKFEELSSREIVKTGDTTQDLALQETVAIVKFENERLREELEQAKEASYNLERNNAMLTGKIKEMEREMEELRESLKCKSDSLQSTLQAFEDMKDEKALILNELNALKSGPVEDMGRGNSLFSEVEDKRKNLEKKIAVLHQKYLESKKALIVKSNALDKLKRENIQFQLLYEDGESKLKGRERKLIESYKQRIDELRHQITILELRPENPQIVTVSDKDLSNMQWIHAIVEQARTEARDVRKSLETKSMEKLFLDEDLYILTEELTNLKKQSMKDKARNEELIMKIEDLSKKLQAYENSKTVNESGLKDEPEKDVPTVKTIRFAPDVKENDGVALKKDTKKRTAFQSVLIDSTNK